jgi:hypothetical protein
LVDTEYSTRDCHGRGLPVQVVKAKFQPSFHKPMSASLS